MKRVIEELNKQITINSSLDMTDEQSSYVAGLSDALDIVLKYSEEEFTLNKRYFVLMPDGYHHAKIEEMKLYKITSRKRECYCFTRKLNDPFCNVTPDLVLSSKDSLLLRVYKTREDAEKNIDCLWRRK